MITKLIKERAWLEINLNHLEHNLKEIKKIVPRKTKIMAVVKANAYGHGMIEVSHKLNDLGINDFAVATLEEGILLRKNKIKGNILILGYTSIENIDYVIKYDLIQTVVDEDYALKLEKFSKKEKIKVHLKINTGLNRLGISYKNFNFIKSLYKNNNLNILGIYSHLSVADSLDKADVLFTKKQISNFNSLLLKLEMAHIDVGKKHIQSSYGILNYSNLKYDYVRPGIILYGVNSQKNRKVKNKLDLKPVLSLKAKITSVKNISKNEFVSYGRMYKSKQKEKIATVSIGYADGYPRNLSLKNSAVLVNKKMALVIGKICMDQLIINVTHIDDIKTGDVVTLIGDGKIRAEDIAFKTGEITNELLCRLGCRLKYFYINK